MNIKAISMMCGLVVFPLVESSEAKDVAVCGSSEGYAYYPSAGLMAEKSAQWTDDPISSGKFTLSISELNKFDLLFTDATGAVMSASQEGAEVLRIGQSEIGITVAVVYPMLIETYTFLQSHSGPEAIWTSNKHSTPILKAGAYRAKCTLINLPPM
jgi:hypothetical protein